MAHEAPGTATFYIYIVVVIGLVLFAGLMSGLTLGLMSLSLVDLEVLMKSGTPQDRKHAAKILPVVKRQHLLLCTLLIGNAIAMEALPIFLDSLVDAYGAIIISVTLILICSEIMPQAVCSRYGLAVGAAMSPVVRVLLIVFFPVSYPISKLLDWILGQNHGSLFRRAELKTLVTLHGGEAGKGGELTHDETTIISGALELTEKTASQAMTPIDLVFSLDVNAKLDLETMRNIMARGHSRIPVYAGDTKNIIGLILVKNLLTLLPHDDMSVRNCTIRKIPRVSEDSPLYDILNDFQKGHSHMAVVVKYNKEKVETLQQRREKIKERRLSGRRSFNVHVDSASTLSNKSLKPTMVEIPESTDIVVGVDEVDSAQRNPADSGIGVLEQGGQLINSRYPVMKLDEEGKASGQVYPQRSKKWAKSGDQNVLEIHEDAPLPTFDDEEVVGIITMEDLIEELLQEEILDETDDYVDIHNKIKVNLLPTGHSPASPTLDMESVHGTGIQSMPIRVSSGINAPSASPWKSPLTSPRTAAVRPATLRTVSYT